MYTLLVTPRLFRCSDTPFEYNDVETGHPLRIVSANGQYMYSDDGSRYLDTRNNVHHGQEVDSLNKLS